MKKPSFVLFLLGFECYLFHLQGEELSEKREESKVLIEKAELLINQDNSFTVTPKTCLRNVVNGTKAVPNSTFHQGSLSWDFEGMKREQGLPLFQNLGNEMDKMVRTLRLHLYCETTFLSHALIDLCWRLLFV